MTLEGAVGLYAGARASSVSLIGWALCSVVEGLASVIVIWRLTGDQALSPTSERTTQRAVAVSFGSLAPAVIEMDRLSLVQALLTNSCVTSRQSQGWPRGPVLRVDCTPRTADPSGRHGVRGNSAQT